MLNSQKKYTNSTKTGITQRFYTLQELKNMHALKNNCHIVLWVYKFFFSNHIVVNNFFYCKLYLYKQHIVNIMRKASIVIIALICKIFSANGLFSKTLKFKFLVSYRQISYFFYSFSQTTVYFKHCFLIINSFTQIDLLFYLTSLTLQFFFKQCNFLKSVIQTKIKIFS